MATAPKPIVRRGAVTGAESRSRLMPLLCRPQLLTDYFLYFMMPGRFPVHRFNMTGQRKGARIALYSRI